MHIPSFVPDKCISALASAPAIQCTIAAGSCFMQNTAMQGGCHIHLHIPYNHVPVPAQVLPLPLPVAAGYLAVVVVSFSYILANGTQEVRSAFLPCGVVGAGYW